MLPNYNSAQAKKIEGKYFPLVLERSESGSDVCENMYMSYVIIYRAQGGQCLFWPLYKKKRDVQYSEH